MLRVTTKTKKDGKLNCAIKSQKANFSEAIGSIVAIRDYILQNETGVMSKEELNKTIMEALKEEK